VLEVGVVTTEAAARAYLAHHLMTVAGRPVAVFNPRDRPIAELPVIYGFNNGGSPGWYSGCLLAEDGAGLGGHICSHEGYMPHDLGILEGSRPDRHEEFRKHYPNGYRMEFVSQGDVKEHKGLMAAYALNQKRGPAT
jgi:hypothetical protein